MILVWATACYVNVETVSVPNKILYLIDFMLFWQPDPTFDTTLWCYLSGCLTKQLIFLDMVSTFQK